MYLPKMPYITHYSLISENVYVKAYMDKAAVLYPLQDKNFNETIANAQKAYGLYKESRRIPQSTQEARKVEKELTKATKFAHFARGMLVGAILAVAVIAFFIELFKK